MFPFRKNTSELDRLKLEILKEALRQYKASFKLACGAIILSACSIAIAIFLLFSHQQIAGSLMATMGSLTTRRGIQLLRETQNAIAVLGE
ncbi:MAG: hypothetical protein J7647_25120 [Cyanobacteria bacterium SBLK]|nr:hypothetical protein [Cyanobacteria bacterium SBLK]